MRDDYEQPASNSAAISPEADWLPQLSLKIIAFLYILASVLGVPDMLLHWFLHGGAFFNFGAILFLFTGRGLLRWQNGWRIGAIIFSCLTVVGGLIVIFLAGSDLISGGNSHTNNWHLSFWNKPVGAFLIACVFVGCAVLQLHVLNRPNIAWRFKNARLARYLIRRQASWNPRHWQFSLQTMFVSTIIAAFVMIQLTNDDIWYHWQHHRVSWVSGMTAHNVEYGTRTKRFVGGPEVLTYVVISNGDRSQSGLGYVTTNVGGRGIHAQLSTHSGRETVPLPGSAQLYEIVDDHIQSSAERVSKQELDSFADRRPDNVSIATLVEHAKWMRQHPNTKRMDVILTPSTWGESVGTGD